MISRFEGGDRMATVTAKISAYIGHIRNAAKKEYATKYAAYAKSERLSISKGVFVRPEYPGLSYMAAQAVRMNIDEILDLF